MSGRRIVVTSGKGGVGKTTTTANVGAALAKRGRNVVLVDTDIGLRNLDLVLGVEKRIVFDLVEVVEGRCQLRQALIRDKRFESLHMLPAAQTREKESVSEEQMSRAHRANLRSKPTYVFIDCPAGIEHGFRAAIAGAREAIVVTTPEVSAIRDADRVVGKLTAARHTAAAHRQSHPARDGEVGRHDVRRRRLRDPFRRVARRVPDDEEIIDTTNRGEPIVLDETKRLAAVYDKIARRLDGELVPFTNLDAPGFFGRS